MGSLAGPQPPGPGAPPTFTHKLHPWDAPPAATLSLECESCLVECKCASSLPGQHPWCFLALPQQPWRPLGMRVDLRPAWPLSHQANLSHPAGSLLGSALILGHIFLLLTYLASEQF